MFVALKGIPGVPSSFRFTSKELGALWWLLGHAEEDWSSEDFISFFERLIADWKDNWSDWKDMSRLQRGEAMDLVSAAMTSLYLLREEISVERSRALAKEMFDLPRGIQKYLSDHAESIRANYLLTYRELRQVPDSVSDEEVERRFWAERDKMYARRRGASVH